MTTPKTPKTAQRRSEVPESRVETAHAKFVETREGTPAYMQAWETLLDALVEE
jgi:hypothetical protein